MLRTGIFCILAFTLQSCCWFGQCNDPTPIPPDPSVSNLPEFEPVPKIIPINVSHLDEVSGIAPSYNFPDALWMIEDSGSEAKLDLLGIDGIYRGKVTFGGANRDWEDLAIGPGPGLNKKYLYISETGDNLESHSEYYVYRFPEPEPGQTHVGEFDTIKFTYPDGASYDVESLMVDPKTKDIYLITKRQLRVKVFRLAYPQNIEANNIAEYLGDLGYWGIVSADISPKGDEILLKSYIAVFYWKIRDNESIFRTLSRPHDLATPYIVEPQGESVCWDLDAKGYYTFSEKAERPEVPPLYYYSKK